MASEADKIRAALDKFVGEVVKMVTLEITDDLITATPVDTGWARANWVPSIGSPVSSPSGTRENVSPALQQAGLATVAVGYKLSAGQVFISNNVPYIGALNGGSSPQAPAGFVQDSIKSGIAGSINKIGKMFG
jgi:hypothetical protein